MARLPHKGVPLEQMTLEQFFDRMMYYRSRSARLHWDAERHATLHVAMLLEKHGEAYREHLPPDFTVDAEGFVHLSRDPEAEVMEEHWKELVGWMHAEYGAQIMDRLPPDTTINPTTGEVTIDPSKDAWF